MAEESIRETFEWFIHDFFDLGELLDAMILTVLMMVVAFLIFDSRGHSLIRRVVVSVYRRFKVSE